MPMIAFIGVRISWLIEARNALFACVADSASSRARWSSLDVPRLLDRSRGERGEGRCHVRVLGGVEVGLQAVDGQHPDEAIADQQRHAHECLDTPAAVGFLLEMLEPRGDVRNDDRLARLDHLAGRIVGPPPVEAQSEQLVEVRKAEAADDHHLVAVELLHGGGSIRHDLPQLREDQIEDLGKIQGARERLGRGAERLGLLAGGRALCPASGRSRSPSRPGRRTRSRCPPAPRHRSRRRTCRC